MAAQELEAFLPPLEVTSREDAVFVNDIENDSSTSSLPTSTDATTEDDEWVYPHPTDFKLSEKPIDEVRELNVAVGV